MDEATFVGAEQQKAANDANSCGHIQVQKEVNVWLGVVMVHVGVAAWVLLIHSLHAHPAVPSASSTASFSCCCLMRGKHHRSCTNVSNRFALLRRMEFETMACTQCFRVRV